MGAVYRKDHAQKAKGTAGVRIFLIMDEVDSRFLCPICREVFKRPTIINTCQHRFCEQCLLQIPPSESGFPICPICRTAFSPQHNCCRDPAYETMIAHTDTVCSGCRQQFPLAYYNDHCTSCPMRNVATLAFKPVAPTSQQVSGGPNRSTFSCPLCTQKNLDCSGLVQHVNTHHASSRTPAVCPVCSSMPWGNPSQLSQNFVQHLNLRHRFEYSTYVDYDQDDDASLQAAIQASINDN